ncbi:MAG: NrfD/PsrC family molybdoenzyme membrane anchor subunit [Burkholderiaceae bacterium]
MSALPTFPASRPGRFWGLLFLAALITGVGLLAAHQMEISGHIITGMNNHVVWGTPHVFAVFMIVAASGALNVASIGSVFGKPMYKARAPLSALLCAALLAGGLMVLMLDLGRPERVIVAATHYNFHSVFAWNVFLYSGMFALVAIYLWTLFEKRMAPWSRRAGLAAFVWRFVLTTGTGSIFGFLVARQAYQSAVLAPLFIVMSFAWGLAVFILAQGAMLRLAGAVLDHDVHRRLRDLLATFIVASLYMVMVYHLTNLYFARQGAFERFMLLEGGIYTAMFWLGYVVVGTVVPLALLFRPGFGGRNAAAWASAAVVIGALAFLYAFIIGGQAYPLQLFPGYEVTSSFMDGQIAPYSPSMPELLLGIGGMGAALLITLVGARLFNMLPADARRPETPSDIAAGETAGEP